MNNAIEPILLGILQGFTEFLPVSSSGHLVIAQSIFGAGSDTGILFEVSLHVATLLAIVLFYRHRLRQLLAGAAALETDAVRYVGKLAVATVPTVAAGLFARNWLEQQFESPVVAGGCLLITGAAVWTTRYTQRRTSLMEPGWTAAILIGCTQAVAILPGISRSGSTVAMALALGVAPLAAAEFSFLLGVIAIAGAGALLLPQLSVVAPSELVAIAWGGAAALLSGLLALWLFIWLLRGQRFHWFAWYAWALGAATLIVFWPSPMV